MKVFTCLARHSSAFRRIHPLSLVCVTWVALSPLAAADTTDATDAFIRAQQSMWPFAPPSHAELSASPRKIYAHRHLFPISYDNKPPTADKYASLMQPGGMQSSDAGGFVRTRSIARTPRRDVAWRIEDAMWDMRLAQAMGVDGFWFNLSLADYKNPDFWPALIEHIEAAERLYSGFTVGLNFDFAAGAQLPGDALADRLVDFLGSKGKLDSPVLQRVNGRLFVTSFAGQRVPPEWWAAFRARLSERGHPPFIMLCTLSWEVENVAKYAALADGFGDWGIRNDPHYDYDSAAAFGTIPTDKITVGMVRGFDVRYKRSGASFYESSGSRILREHWRAVIDSTRVNWAQLVTWNDLGEDTQFRPNSSKQFSVYDLSAYYLAWFKTGKPPAITRDALYYFHRIQRADAAPPPGLLKAKVRADSPPAEDIIEVIAFLTAPGTVQVETEAGLFTEEAPAGVSRFTAPLPENGRPVFRILRGDKHVVEIASAFAVATPDGQDDMAYRGGGSLRTLYGQQHPAVSECARGSEASEMALGEPVWLAH